MNTSTFFFFFLCLDIETAIDDVEEIHKFAAWRADTKESVSLLGRQIPLSIQRINALTEGAGFVLGHNVIRHDLPVLARCFPDLALNALPAVDTLELSPIAFPANPYHSLVKDYKLVRDGRNDPLRDAQLALKLWADQYAAFEVLNESSPEELACHHFFLAKNANGGVGSFFAKLRRKLAPKANEVRDAARNLCHGKVCPNKLDLILEHALSEQSSGLSFAYVLAWLRVSGGNSVLPPWVRLQYPETVRYLRELRETPCGQADCPYCSVYLDPSKELSRYCVFW